MSFYCINTDTDALGYSPHAKWIRYEYAFTSGDGTQEGYEKFGEHKLGKLKPDDILFMYANKLGVVAAGKVTDYWQGSSYEGSDRLVYQYATEYADCTEYRIPVDWYLPIVNNPVSAEEFNKIRHKKNISKEALWSIDEDAGRKLLNEVQSRVSQC